MIFHDQGHKPARMGVEVGARSIVGQNYRMTELTGAVALAQLRKIEKIISTLHEKKKKLKDAISNVKGIGFRKINDEEECGTLLTLLFENKEVTDKFCEKVGTKSLYHSGWHVYNNMENILGKKMPTKFGCPFECPYYKNKIEYAPHMLPRTDDILQRSVNISVGVVDNGLGAGFGINILSSHEEIAKCATKIKRAALEVL